MTFGCVNGLTEEYWLAGDVIMGDLEAVYEY